MMAPTTIKGMTTLKGVFGVFDDEGEVVALSSAAELLSELRNEEDLLLELAEVVLCASELLGLLNEVGREFEVGIVGSTNRLVSARSLVSVVIRSVGEIGWTRAVAVSGVYSPLL